MKLIVVSHTEHYRSHDGRLVGWEPTVREIDSVSCLFDEVVHIAPLHSGSPTESFVPYRSGKVRIREISPAGGEWIWDKIGIFRCMPQYFATITSEMLSADVVHVRCPAAVSLVALAILAVFPKPKKRWIKYAGNWKPSGPDPLSYRLQRWWLKRGFGGLLVTVNGSWSQQETHIRTFLNPSLTDGELRKARICGEKKTYGRRPCFLFVGRLDETKGIYRFLEVMKKVHDEGLRYEAHVIGGGENEASCVEWTRKHKLESSIWFHGWKSRRKLAEFYRKAHFVVLPSATEGWPKVISEAMSYGAVPVAGAVSSIPQMLEQYGTGRSVPVSDIEAYWQAIRLYYEDPTQWEKESRLGMVAAEQFTYTRYVEAIQQMLG